MANTVLERTLNNVNQEDLKAGYAAPQGAVDQFGNSIPSGSFAGTDETMSVTGSARAALGLFAIVVAVGTWAWISIPDKNLRVVVIAAALLGFAIVLLTRSKPKIARITAPLYAVMQGLVLGLISRIYENAYSGIVVQAVLATGAIVFVMYTLYSTGILKVTPRFRKIVISATMGIAVFYGLSFLLSFFDVGIPLVFDSGPVGIIFSLFFISIAASTLALDFDFIERGSQAGLPKYMDWAAGFGLIVSIVWIYLEVLRLLGNIRN
ncbi:MAG TPA: Bax inhibitor-1/YccA family protein [Acidimicrobiia bacterium]|nr:Bax inhibitor-1/YccA family protein [Acidimicrobiia bacterium]